MRDEMCGGGGGEEVTEGWREEDEGKEEKVWAFCEISICLSGS